MSMTKLLLIHLTFVAEEAASLEKTFSVFVSPARGGKQTSSCITFSFLVCFAPARWNFCSWYDNDVEVLITVS